ncbi:holin [Vibrio phage vB_VhaP_VH-5]|uniref:Holin n=1 Tax=Vibrio phage vB_VhaP_VH-5 TaxID=2660694 RepID=A0A5Q2W6H1_9CAUD|nr:holin [Vibrio phage vB_VhaP_VH-5]
MNIIEQVYAATVLWWAGLDKFPITSGATAFVVASLRMRNEGNYKFSEALLCGVFAMIATVCLSFLSVLIAMDVPVEVSSGVGGAIGWYGTKRTVDFIERKVSRSKRRGYDIDKS